MMHSRNVMICAALCFILGCDKTAGCNTTTNKTMPSAVAANSQSSELPAQREVARALNGFTFDLHRKLATSENVAYAPLSIGNVLAMTYAGAKGETAEEMATTLRAKGIDDFHAKVGALGWHVGSDNSSAIRVSDDLWIDERLDVRDDYKTSIKDNYGATLRSLDFADTSAAARKINGHVSSFTEDYIDKLVSPASLDANSRLVVTNAIYFDAKWDKPFDPEKTNEWTFGLASGERVKADMMFQNERFLYAYEDGARMVALPYRDTHLTALGILPVDESLAELEARIDAEMFGRLRSALTEEELDVAIPKVRVRSKVELDDALQAMGMKAAFDTRRADFGALSNQPLFIDQVGHAAFIELDEEGTTAAAATAAEEAAMAAEMMPEFIANRPFLFFVVDERSGAIVFVARIGNPEAL